MHADKEMRARGEEMPPRMTIFGRPVPPAEKQLGKTSYQKWTLKAIKRLKKESKQQFETEEMEHDLGRSVRLLVVRTKEPKSVKRGIPRLGVAVNTVQKALGAVKLAKKKRLLERGPIAAAGPQCFYDKHLNINSHTHPGLWHRPSTNLQ